MPTSARLAPSRKVLHFITAVGGGGAENFMRQLVVHLRTVGWESVVVVPRVYPHEALAEQLRASGVRVIDLGHAALMKPRLLFDLSRTIRAEAPDVVQTWMHHADLLGSFAALSAGCRRIVWGVRATGVHRNPTDSAFKTTTFHLLLGLASRIIPSAIITNSEAAIGVHSAMGYPRERFIRVANGVNTERFRPDGEARASTRQALGIPLDAPVLGCVARFHPMKDHATLLRAAQVLQTKLPKLHIVLVGGEASQLDNDCQALLPSVQNVHCVPFTNDAQAFYPAFDAFTLTSNSTEGLSNAVLEAMATGLPLIVTNTGDSAVVVRGVGDVVAIGDVEGLAAMWHRALTLTPPERMLVANATRHRAKTDYTMEAAAKQFARVYAEVLK